MYNSKLELSEFSNNVWKVYWTIANDIILIEKKTELDEVTVALYLEKHKKLLEKYEEYGGYDTILKAQEYVKVGNYDGYIQELKKWNAVLTLGKRKFPIADKISEFVDMTADEIYDEYSVLLNDSFLNVETDIKTYDICDGIYELIDKLDEGFAVGLPYNELPMLTKETGGQYLGAITLLGGLSNVGKSTVARTGVIPTCLKKKERLVIMLNEDGLAKWQREMLVWTVNNIFKEDMQKHIVRDGKYTEPTKELLIKAAKWLEEQSKNHLITIVPFKEYKTKSAIKIIKKYISLGDVKYFMLDTFKLDAGKVSDKAWMEMQQSMVEINDVIKPENKNVHILITFQLAKGSIKQRYYTQDNVGMAKNIIDPVSTCIMVRDLYDDEYTGEKRELKVYQLKDKEGRTQIPQRLSKDKRYQILFIIKNREGSANQFQIVIEHDMSRNIIKEIGRTCVPIDF